MADDLLYQSPQIGLPRQVVTVTGDVDSGQHYFGYSFVDQLLDMFHHLSGRDRPAVAAAIGNDAKGAAMVAASLHLDKGTFEERLT